MDYYKTSNEEERVSAASEIIAKIKHMNPKNREKIVDRIVELSGVLLPALMLTADELKELVKAGVEIGGHTHSHPILKSLPDEECRAEILRGKMELEKIIGKRVRYFAFPNGKPGSDFNDHHIRIVEDLGFEAAFSTEWGVSDISSCRYKIPRFTPWDKNPYSFALRLAKNFRDLVR